MPQSPTVTRAPHLAGRLVREPAASPPGNKKGAGVTPAPLMRRMNEVFLELEPHTDTILATNTIVIGAVSLAGSVGRTAAAADNRRLSIRQVLDRPEYLDILIFERLVSPRKIERRHTVDVVIEERRRGGCGLRAYPVRNAGFVD